MVKRNAHIDMTLTKINFLFVIFLIICCVCFSFPQGIYAQKGRPDEYQVKAAFIYNFVKFIDLPDGLYKNSTKTAVCILGEDPFEEHIDLIHGKYANNRVLTAKHVRTIQEAGDCQVLYISPSEKKNITQIIKELDGRSILTIGDTEGFAQQGVIINLFLEQDKVRFEINISSAKEAKIQISSKLLKLAKIIDETKGSK